MRDPREIDRRSGAAYERRAVIDIGSNSVRLVIFDGPRRAPFPICNEKSLCGLGRDMSPEGDLDLKAVSFALETLARFKHLLNDHENPPVEAFATAAVREARNAEALLGPARAMGFDISVIGGEREAELAALGVVSYEPGATGIVGDMGGGSLELIGVDAGVISDKVSLYVGPLKLTQKFGSDQKAAQQFVKEELAKAAWIKEDRFSTFYMVGGAWRAVARIHMRHRRHPLSVLHHYQMTPADIVEVCDLVARSSAQSLEAIPGVPKRRVDTLPYASLVLKAVVEKAKVKRVLVSAGGVREGVLFEQLSDAERQEEPLRVGARFIAERLSPSIEYGAVVERCVAPLFVGETIDAARVRRAACELIDIGAYFHPDMRGLHAFDTALRAPFYGVSHADRAIIAYALYVRHQGKTGEGFGDAVIQLLDPDETDMAVKLGLALRFVAAFAPKSPTALDNCRLSIEGDTLLFNAPLSARPLMQDSQMRRLETLAAAFGKAARATFQD